jgi:hypothetical protein
VEKRNRSNYYSCAVCLENNSRKYRKKKWQKYLAGKANCRKEKSDEILTELDIQKLFEDQNGKCILSGVTFDIESKWDRPSLDRIDNLKGYSKDNIQLVTWRINHARGELSVVEFIQMCYDVVDRQRELYAKHYKKVIEGFQL